MSCETLLKGIEIIPKQEGLDRNALTCIQAMPQNKVYYAIKYGALL